MYFTDKIKSVTVSRSKHDEIRFTNCSCLFVFYKNRFIFAGCLCLMKHALTGTSRCNEHPDLFMVAACGLGHKRFLLFSILIVQAVSSPP